MPATRGEIDFLEAVAGIFRARGDGDLAIPDISGVLESYESSIEQPSVGSSLQTWINHGLWIWRLDIVLPPRLTAQRPWQPAAANCSNKRTTWRLPMRLFAAGLARMTLNDARSATLQAKG
jgi:hypothetical protein